MSEMTETVAKIYDCLLDPKWQIGTLKFDNKEMIYITLSHPEHGRITSLVPKDTAQWMAQRLTKIVFTP